jgi:hypothetical protein
LDHPWELAFRYSMGVKSTLGLGAFNETDQNH